MSTYKTLRHSILRLVSHIDDWTGLPTFIRLQFEKDLALEYCPSYATSVLLTT